MTIAEPIHTIGELLRELLRQRDVNVYPRLLERYAVPGHDLEVYFRWNTRHYTRTCIHRNEDLELLVICYEPGQSTSIHDFNSQSAWVYPLVGEVVEERFELRPDGNLQRMNEVQLSAGDSGCFTSNKGIHRFSNRGTERAVTLNLYAKPMSQWRVYDERTGNATLSPAGPPR